MIPTILKYAAGRVLALAGQSEAHPGKAKTLTLISAISGVLGVSKDASTGLADVLVMIADLLRAI